MKEIDLQHRYFLELINRLSRELVKTPNARFRSALIAELNAYAAFHFISEENMMMFSGYPELEKHRQQHAGLLSHLANMELEMDISGTDNNREFDKIIEFLTDWFLHHTAEADQRFAVYLKREAIIAD